MIVVSVVWCAILFVFMVPKVSDSRSQQRAASKSNSRARFKNRTFSCTIDANELCDLSSWLYGEFYYSPITVQCHRQTLPSSYPPLTSHRANMHHLQITLKIMQLFTIFCAVIIRQCLGYDGRTFSESHSSPSSSSNPSHPTSFNTQSAHHFLPNLFQLRPKKTLDFYHHNISPVHTVTYSPTRLHGSFLKAAKGDITEAWRRFHETLAWRRKERIDLILHEKHEHFEIIKAHYPHYFHLRGWKNEPVYYEKPAKMNLAAMRRQGTCLLSICTTVLVVFLDFACNNQNYSNFNDTFQRNYCRHITSTLCINYRIYVEMFGP